MKNLIHIYDKNDFPIDQHSYGQTIVINELSKYQKKDFNIYLLTTVKPVTGQEAFYEVADKSVKESLGINVVRINKGTNNAETMSNMYECIRSLDGQSMVDLHFMTASRLLEKERTPNIKTMAHWHCLSDLYSFGPHMRRPDDYKRMNGYLEDKLIDLNIGVSEHVKESFKYFPNMHKNMNVVMNGVNEQLYTPLNVDERTTLREECLKISPKATVIGYVGRMQELKGVDIIKNLLEKLESQNDETYFVFASSNGLDRTNFFKYVEDNCSELIDSKRIRIGFDISKFLTGQKEYDNLVSESFKSSLSNDGITDSEIYAGLFTTPLVQLLDIYLHPARSEALGLSVVEAQMAGTRTIASYIGGIPEVITDIKNNRLVPLPLDINIPYPKTNDELILKSRAVEQAATDFMDAIEKFKGMPYDFDTANKIRKSVLLRDNPLTSERMAYQTTKLINKVFE
ncbi:MAG: glycosyltransferase family 4 protein [Candidatus Nanoarchaeia archaeon]|jgi:glycosyltransferase involved in cell wall biosynthesis